MSGRNGARALGLPELIAMGVGGMIGGGIFSILGLAVQVSGKAAALAFLTGGAIALVAGYSYSRLAVTYHSDGASFTYLERAFPQRPAIAGVAGWTVVAGYLGTLALYAFTFGAYASHLLGLSESAIARVFLSLGVLALFTIVNLAGAKTMGRAEDMVVYAKIVLLASLAVAGFFTMDGERLRPLFDRGVGSALLGGALIFVAYEGFQLITNAVCETREPERDVPRAIYGSVAITSAIYVAIAVIAVGNLDLAAITQAKEYALAVVARPVFGRAGVVLVDLAAMLATSSAINATLFGSARLAGQMAVESLAPAVFSFRSKTDVPTAGVLVIAALAGLFAMLGSLEVIASFSSMTFLLVSIGVCVANLRLRARTGSRLTPILAGLALMSATVVLLTYYLARHDPVTLAFTVSVYAATAVAHLAFEEPRARRRPVASRSA